MRTARRKNAIFWSKFSKKCLKTPFLACFFKILPAAQTIWPKLGQKPCFGRARKINLVDLKKNVKIFKKFLKSAALEKILDPPLKTTPLLEPLDYNNLGLMKKDLLVEVVKSIKRDHFDRRGAKLVKMICVKDLKNVKNYTLLRQNLSVFGSLPN